MLLPLLLLELALELFERDEDDEEGDVSAGLLDWLLMVTNAGQTIHKLMNMEEFYKEADTSTDK